LFTSITWTLGREEAAGGGVEEGREEEEVLTGNFGEDNRFEPSRKRTKEKLKIVMVVFVFVSKKIYFLFCFFLQASSSVCTNKLQKK
jgi:hypothetical protein